MKKKILITLIAVCTMFFSFGMINASVNAENVEYEEYYTYLKNMEYVSCEKYFNENILYRDIIPGVVYARLIDFDKNGVFELITVEVKVSGGAVNYNVYTLSDNEMLQIATGGIGDWDDIYAGFGFCTDSNGKDFLVIVNVDQMLEYGTYTDGQWIESSAMWDTIGTSVRIDGQRHYLSTIRSAVYYIDGERVDVEQFDNYVSEKRTIAYETYNFRGTTYKNDGISNWYINTFPVPEWTPYEVMDTISSMYPGYFDPSTWARETVQLATVDGYVPDRVKMKYTDAITREEFCEIATLFYEKYRGSIENKNVSFSDTTNESVLKMASLGVVTGIGNNQFAPNDSLTREMAATILGRLAKSMNIPLSIGDPNFIDNNDISSWAYENVGISQSSRIMNGNADGTFAPKNHYTREQAIVTVYRLKNLFVPVERIEIKENVNVIVDEKCTLPNVDIYPENATDLRLTFKSANEKIFTCTDGAIQAVEEGTSQLIAVSPNGVETKTNVTVTPKVFISPKPNLNTLLNVIEDTSDPIFRGSLPNGYDSFPNGKTISSKVKVTGVKKLLRGNVEVTAMLSEITTGYDNEYAEYNQPYLKWKLLNESGKEIDNGLSLLRNLKKVGDQETIQLDFGDLPKGNYTLEFINLEGREFDLKEQEPKIIVKGLPLKLSSVGLVEGSETRDRSDDVTETFTAKLIDIECYFEYSKSDDMYYLSCDLIGEAENGSKWASQRISWTLTDSAGDEIDDGTETIYFEDEICIEDFIENYDLEPGETYYITIKAKKNTSYYEGVDYDCIIYE